MWQMLQAETPADYVIATGETHSVAEFCAAAFGALGLEWEPYVVADPVFTRPAEVDLLLGDASKAREELGWSPEVSFEELVRMMVEADLARLECPWLRRCSVRRISASAPLLAAIRTQKSWTAKGPTPRL